ncbi:protein kinase [Prosthecobacter sp.]|uniref:protein kinase domain-containing protein n=1 Tax=Prosthecobacter sp. TaxID=1965333 RepID=UPI002AB9EE2A|nr:protein kinase [Prosthecobacter sp.]MDZ4404535.1 protein kinase [Prosthecobacter sp.]
MPENAEKQHDPDATIPMAAPVPTASAKESPDLPLPEELTLLLPHGNYSVEGFLGQGGMGAVYKGTQVRLQRQVAIKIMRRDQGKDHGFEERFRREALALAQLNHPNIVNVIDYGEAGPDYLYIVMEFVDGTDLVGVIRSGEMTQETALKLLPQICDALQFAHDNGIVHRDIKPANILLTRDGRIKMADFGLAKRFDVNSTFQTQTGAGMGTPDYAAPEQFDPNGNVDHRADIYELGVMIYQMVTGQLPRGAWKPPSEKADVDTHWDKIVSHALQTDPSDRYASVSEIKTDISSITAAPGAQGGVTGRATSRKSGFSGTLGGSTTVLTQAGGRSATVVQAPAPPRSKKPLVFGLAGALVLSAAVGFLMWNKDRPSVEPTVHVVSRTWTPPAPTVTIGTEWTDLIPRIKPERDAIRGGWTVNEKGLTAQRAQWAMCNIPVQDPGTDYDLRYKVTRGEGMHLAMFFLFRKGDTGGFAPVDYVDASKPEFSNGMRIAGLESVQNTITFRPGGVGGWQKEWLPRGKTCTVLLQVREKEVRLSVDDVEAFRWQADWSQIRQRPNAEHPMFKDTSGSPFFGVGIFDCEAVFHSIEMRRIGETTVPIAPIGEPGSIPHLLTSPDYEWSAPVNLGPLVNSPTVDLGPIVSPDGLHLVFSSKREGDGELFESRRSSADAPWGKPTLVFPSIEDGHQDQPWMSVDELRLFYHATAGPGHHGRLPEGDVYFRQRAAKDQPWQPPVNLGSGINSLGHDVAPRLSNDERTLLFTSIRPGGQGIWDVWRTRRTSREAAFGRAENVGSELNSAGSDFHAAFAADDRTLLFLRGGSDIKVCRLFMAAPDASGQYQTTALDFPVTGKLSNPWLSADGRTLWFAWDGPGSLGDMDLWEIRRVPKAKKNPPTPAAATKDTPFENTLGIKFVPVPITGGPTDGKRVLFSVWETRVQDYEAFVKETKREWLPVMFSQAPTHPALNISWDDAQAFCAWLTERELKVGRLRENERYRLPSDHEWSCAVGIGTQESPTMLPLAKDQRINDVYTWGTEWPPPAGAGNFAGEELKAVLAAGEYDYITTPISGYNDGYNETAPVGSFRANSLGLHDLGGNAWEWCEDWFDNTHEARVLRGTAWAHFERLNLLSSKRSRGRVGVALPPFIGFRCVLEFSVASAGKQ